MANCMRCDECIYRANDLWHTCDYALLTGKTRTKRNKPLKKGQCDYFVKGNRLSAVQELSLPRREKYDWSAARPMYNNGASDSEIAEVIGCIRQVVGDWRRRNGLPPNVKKRKVIKQAVAEKPKAKTLAKVEKKQRERKRTPVAKLDKETLAVLAVYPSVYEAARANHLPKTNIFYCIKGKYKTCGGYKWRAM